MILTSPLTLPKSSTSAILCDTAAPSYSWRDLEFQEFPDPSGTDAPQLIAFRGGVRVHFYQTSPSADKIDLRGHIPHDWVPNSDAFIHVHWSHDATAISGNIVFTFESTYAKGHNQAIFPATKTVTLTYNTVNIATTPQYNHMITEVQWCSAGGSATLFDSSLVEIDGLILGTCTMTTLPTLTGGTLVTGNHGVWIHRVDIHYRSRELGSKQKSPNFYT